MEYINYLWEQVKGIGIAIAGGVVASVGVIVLFNNSYGWIPLFLGIGLIGYGKFYYNKFFFGREEENHIFIKSGRYR